MDITIIGTGNMARGIATRAVEGGQNVTLLGTAKAKADALAQELPGEVHTGQVGDPLAGDVVVLAVWYQAVPTYSLATATSSTARSSSTSPTRSTRRPTRR